MSLGPARKSVVPRRPVLQAEVRRRGIQVVRFAFASLEVEIAGTGKGCLDYTQLPAEYMGMPAASCYGLL